MAKKAYYTIRDAWVPYERMVTRRMPVRIPETQSFSEPRRTQETYKVGHRTRTWHLSEHGNPRLILRDTLMIALCGSGAQRHELPDQSGVLAPARWEENTHERITSVVQLPRNICTKCKRIAFHKEMDSAHLNRFVDTERFNKWFLDDRRRGQQGVGTMPLGCLNVDGQRLLAALLHDVPSPKYRQVNLTKANYGWLWFKWDILKQKKVDSGHLNKIHAFAQCLNTGQSPDATLHRRLTDTLILRDFLLEKGEMIEARVEMVDTSWTHPRKGRYIRLSVR